MNAPVSREEFEALQRQVVELQRRLDSLSRPDIDDETLSVVAASVAAFLGKRATVKLVRRVNPDEVRAWGAQGRAAVVANHNLPSTRGW